MGVLIRLPMRPADATPRSAAAAGPASILLFTGVWRERYTVEPTLGRKPRKGAKSQDRRKKRA